MKNPLKANNRFIRRLCLVVCCLTIMPISLLVAIVVEVWREAARAYYNVRLWSTFCDMKTTLCMFIKQVWKGTL